MRAFGFRLFLGIAWCGSFAAPASADDLFERAIRPALVKYCYECHSSEGKKVKGGLRLDSADGWRTGGDSGPALVPGKPEDSLLISALRHDGLAMPPTQKLPDTVVADFERWIKAGAPDPRTAAPAKTGEPRTGMSVADGKNFWSFKPIQKSAIPAVKDESWPANDVDRFILAALEAKGLHPVADADRAVWLRRVTVALAGLPPTPTELDAFLADKTPEAYARAVDRLLAAPTFGERWGRHWLDLARYADSNGRDENLTFHDAYRYRDWVVGCFNADKPYSEFVREQLAGDLLPAADRRRRDELLTATGFLVVGPKVLADRDVLKRKMDVVDEQIDAVGRAFMGMTLGCARCHDHKFDPVPTRDYYALAGVFASTRTLDGIKLGNVVVSGWMLRPLGDDGDRTLAAFRDHEKKLKSATDALKKAKDALKKEETSAGMRVGEKFLGIVVDDSEATLKGAWRMSTYTQPYVGVGYIHDDKAGKGTKSATFAPNLPKAGAYEVFVAYTTGDSRATNVPVEIHHADGRKTVTVNQKKAPKLDGLFHSLGVYKFAAGKAGKVTISNAGTAGHVIVDAVRFVPQGELANDRDMAMGVPDGVRKKIASTKANVAKLEAAAQKLKGAAPPAPKLAMAVRDEDRVANAHVNVRGNPHQLGAEVPRGFLQVAATGGDAAIPSGQSGRRELADWLADPRHPLVARVYVNRVWKHLFGEGLVRTVDNFGVQGERPSHPELLDFLAAKFVAEGWSTKKLIRTLALSRVYRLAAVNDPAALKADPENRLLWRANRTRVDAEVLRDSMLALSDRLDRTAGGPVVAHLGERAIDNDSKGGVAIEESRKRSVYLPIVRNDVPAMLTAFDFADPDVGNGRRDSTTVPTQALLLMNSPAVSAWAKRAAERLLKTEKTDADRLRTLYLTAYARPPASAEIARVQAFVAEQPDAVKAWTGVCLAVFSSTEFRFVD